MCDGSQRQSRFVGCTFSFAHRGVFCGGALPGCGGGVDQKGGRGGGGVVPFCGYNWKCLAHCVRGGGTTYDAKRSHRRVDDDEPTGGRLQPVLMRHTPRLSVKTCGGGGRSWGGGVQPGVGGGGSRWGSGGGSCRGSGGGPAGGRGGGSGRGSGGRPARGERGGGLGLALGLGSPSWWNQSWFYNPF